MSNATDCDVPFLGFRKFEGKMLAGRHVRMSYAQNRTIELWSAFGSQRKLIANEADEYLYSLEVYPEGFFMQFDPHREFEKWAAVEVTHKGKLPAGLEHLECPAGTYAVFLHRGPASKAAQTYNYIFREWLPTSGFHLDDKPHFAVMDSKYRKDDPDSKEQIWIPVKKS